MVSYDGKTGWLVRTPVEGPLGVSVVLGAALGDVDVRDWAEATPAAANSSDKTRMLMMLC